MIQTSVKIMILSGEFETESMKKKAKVAKTPHVWYESLNSSVGYSPMLHRTALSILQRIKLQS